MLLVEIAASSGAFDSIPIVNIGHTSTTEERAASARQIRDACMNVEFCYIRNHGIPEKMIDRVLSAMTAYFSLRIEMKMKLYHREGANYRGYAPVLDSNIDSENKGVLFEGFVISREEVIFEENDDKEANADTTIIPNLWPSEPAAVREAFVNYYHAAVSIRNALFRLFALALDLPETYFDDKNKNLPTMRGHQYPPQAGSEEEYILGINAHAE
ncbi:hypothetical protein BKA82DRAFT_4363271 [Pisolithus tinctorius]|nr:hypothetical protein BKA82DRAFT_4363271 [Pisolithus tinctorius]